MRPLTLSEVERAEQRRYEAYIEEFCKREWAAVAQAEAELEYEPIPAADSIHEPDHDIDYETCEDAWIWDGFGVGRF